MTSKQSNPEPSVPGEDTELNRLVVECLDRMEKEGESALDALCNEHPDVANAIRARVRVLHDAGLWGSKEIAPEIPERLGDFRLIHKLGEGGMGVVYLATQESVGRTVALKLMRPERIYFGGARERFQREVESVGRLQHPGIVAVHTVGEEAGIPFFAMEHVQGCSLADVLQELAERDPRNLSGRDFAEILAQRTDTAVGEILDQAPIFTGSWIEACFCIAREAAVAIDHAHRSGVLHRDVKPSNIMVTGRGRVVVLDFGLASIEGDDKLTHTGVALGSPAYMAPEQVRGEETDRRTDVYGLGATLYELLTLQSPFASSTAGKTQMRIVEAKVPPLRTFNRAVSLDAETVCLTAMDVEPDRRYPDAGDFARDLDNYLGLRPIEARRPGPWLRTRKWIRRNPARSVAISLAAVIVVGGPLAFAVQQHYANLEIRKQRDQAIENFRMAVEAVDKMLTRVGDATLAHIPAMEKTRRQLLEDAIEFHERFLELRRDDRDVRLNAARTYQKLATQHWIFIQLDQARLALERSHALFSGLQQEFPESGELAAELSWVKNQNAALLKAEGKFDEALPIFHEAREELLAAVDQSPKANLVARLGSVHANIGETLHGLEKHKEALEHRKKCVAWMEDSVNLAPDDPELRFLLATALDNLGVALQAAGHANEAAIAFKDTIESYEELLTRKPESGQYRYGLVTALNALALLQRSEKKLDLALETARTAEKEARRLIADYPSVPVYRHRFGGVLQTIAVTLWDQGSISRPNRTALWNTARQANEEAIQCSHRALRMAPQHPQFLGFLAKQRRFQAHQIQNLALFREALDYADACTKEFPDDVWSARFAAKTIAISIIWLRRDKSIPGKQRANLVADYQRRAVFFLRQAVKNGCRTVAELEQGRPGWNTHIKKTSAYEALLREMKATESGNKDR